MPRPQRGPAGTIGTLVAARAVSASNSLAGRCSSARRPPNGIPRPGTDRNGRQRRTDPARSLAVTLARDVCSTFRVRRLQRGRARRIRGRGISASASPTASSSLTWSRPADRPRRCGSTTVVCSTSTRVSSPSALITGRNVAGAALVDVGATMVVLRCRNSWRERPRRSARHVAPAARGSWRG